MKILLNILIFRINNFCFSKSFTSMEKHFLHLANIEEENQHLNIERCICILRYQNWWVIGEISNKKIVIEWELAYHEILSICNAFRNITNGVVDFRDTDLHHEFSGNLNLELNLRFIKVVDYINSKTNPFAVSSETKLYNFSTGQIVSDHISERILCFYDGGKGKYIEYRQEPYIERGSKISDTIKKVNYPNFLSSATKAKMKQQNPKARFKEMSESQKQMDTARSRGIQLKEILKHDLTTENCLFDGDYIAKTKQKHLVHNLEKLIKHNAPQFHKYLSEPTALLVDFLSVIRRVPLKNVSKIIDAFDLSWNTINVCSHSTLNIIYDSYIESSLKVCQRDRRSEKDPLEIMNIKLQSPIPV